MALTPPEQVTRNRSTSTSTSELPQHEHKRPRLDTDPEIARFSPEASEEVMVGVPQSRTISPQPPSAMSQPDTPPSTSHSSSNVSTMISPNSKMTINTRPLSAHSATNDAMPNGGEEGTNMQAQSSTAYNSKSISPVVISAPNNDTMSNIPGNADDPITIPSSPETQEEDVPIEIGPPLDVSDTEQETECSPVTDPFAQRIWHTFPYKKETPKAQIIRFLPTVAETLEHGTGSSFSSVLAELTTWLTDIQSIIDAQNGEAFQQDADFYQCLPVLLQALLRRRGALPLDVSETDLVNFVKAFAYLTLHVVRLDIEVLSSVNDASALNPANWAYSPDYLRFLAFTVAPGNGCFLHVTLKNSRQVEVREFCTLITQSLFKESIAKPFEALKDLFDTLAEKFPTTSPHRALLVQLMVNFRQLLQAILLYLQPLDLPQTSRLNRLTYQFVANADAVLQQAITKQHPWLTIENCSHCLDAFSRLLHAASTLHPDLISYALQKAQLPNFDTGSVEPLEFAGEAYKLAFFKQLIQHGRMELRVFGIETMASTFVEMWLRTHKLPQSRGELLVKFVIDFLRCNDMVSYILSVGSHPQIVQRSSNVIGFLCVSHHWSQSDTDVAWQAVLGSEDHRSAAAIVDVLKTNLEHLNVEALLYLLRKLHETPFEVYDSRMLGFALDLLNALKTRSSQALDTKPQVNARAVEFCVHVLRESHTPTNACSDLAEQVRSHVYDFMSRQGIMGLESSDREQLLSTICNDIATHSDRATGSVIGMNAILQTLNALHAAEMIASHDFAKLLIGDMTALSVNFVSNKISEPPRSFEIEYTMRLCCLLSLILKAPQAFDETLCRLFWTNVLTSDLPHEIRSRAWKVLADAYGQSNSPNPLVEFVSSQFTNDLPGHHLDMAVLDFARSAVNFESRHHVADISSVDDCLSLPSIEKVWQIMLETTEENVKNEAMKFIVHVYLDSTVLLRRNQTSVDQTHAMLVERCIQTVIDSASELNSPSPLTLTTLAHQEVGTRPNMHPVNRPQTRVNRSLDLLRSFLNGLKMRPRYKPTASETIGPALATFPQRGEPISVSLRVAAHPRMRDEIVSWTIGQDNTGHEVWQFLTELTGWSQINVIYAGNRLQLQAKQTPMKDIKFGLGPISISKAMHATDVGLHRAARASSPVDLRVMHHFDDLYALLEAQEPVASAVYDFLTMFSSQEMIVSEIRSMTLQAQSLLPVTKPFKLLYFATALRGCIEEESFSNNPNADFLTYAVHSILDTMDNIQAANLEYSLHMTILRGIIETLQLAMKAKVPEATSAAYFRDDKAFVSSILASWASVQTGLSDETSSLNRIFLDVIIDASLHQNELWRFIKEDQRFSQLLASSLLFTSNSDTRQGVQGVISRLAGVSEGKAIKANDARAARARFALEKIVDCLKHIWDSINPLIAQACENPWRCREVLDAAMALFGVVAKELDEQVLLSLYSEMKALLLHQHNPMRNIFCANEYLPFALARLLSDCITVLKTKGTTAPDTLDLITKVYEQCLFPPLSIDSTASLQQQKVPLVDHDTRTALYDLLLCAAQSRRTLSAIVAEMDDSSIDRDAFNTHTMNERKALRSEQGYCGLRNLSNTCYLNSLLSQLFMNLKFRELIIGMNVVDHDKQKLIYELGNLFANMQSSYEKFVDPVDAVDSITQYTGEPIDVTVQMDVDEFFNLLFDRLEAQIVDSGAQRAFKAMYGGQLVQQIKSKECEHVSERTEPFSAVQIEIRGKSGLTEGLAAYVEGEVLQGDNKYSCTSCGRHVDAVKRACIKDLPDNLIFNLKRFDYDIMTGLRTKVNDEFEFPDSIDMTPYTFNALSDPDRVLPPDMFELVGVIVHSGTAETGHYYSFVRQRPSARSWKDSWVQFNDSDVTQFDPADMKDQAFGGHDQTFNALPKFYNGYMLFYQRTSSIRQYEQDYAVTDVHVPFSVSLRTELDNSIALENEITLRRYVAQDPAHAKFVRQIAQRLSMDGEACSDSHDDEDRLLLSVLDYVQQVSSRWKELPEFEDTMKVLHQYAHSCWRCALKIAQWFQTNGNIIATVLRAWYLPARKNFASLLATCCGLLFPLIHTEGEISQSARGVIDDTMTKAFSHMFKDWNQLQKTPRGWDQFFGLLVAVAKLGPRQRTFLVELNFLEKVGEIVWIHAGPTVKGTPKWIRQQYFTYFALREKHRSFNHGMAIQLFAELLTAIEIDIPRSGQKPGALQPSHSEVLLLQLQDDGKLEWLRRIIHVGSHPDAVCDVVKVLCEYPNLTARTHDTLVDGLEQTPEYHAAAHFIRPCLVYIVNASSKKFVVEMITRTLRAIAETDGYCSQQYLDYVQCLTKLDTTEAGLDRAAIVNLVLKQVGYWAPMLLLASNDMHHDVRTDTMILLREILFTQMNAATLEDIRDDETAMQTLRSLAKGCATHVSKNFTTLSQDRSQSRMVYTSGQNRQIIAVLEELERFLDTGNAEDDELVTEIKHAVSELQMLDSATEDDQLNWEENSEPLSDVEFSEVSP